MKGSLMVSGWSPRTRKRADKDHAHKKLVKAQKLHLTRIKSAEEIRRILLAGRYGHKL